MGIKVGPHLRRVGKIRWHVKGYEYDRKNTAQVLKADQPTLPVAGPEVSRLISKVRAKQAKRKR